MKNITCFHRKIIIFKALKNRSILHGGVYVMRITNSVDPDSTAPLGAVWCRSALLSFLYTDSEC